jgi:hypothetical protein
MDPNTPDYWRGLEKSVRASATSFAIQTGVKPTTSTWSM